MEEIRKGTESTQEKGLEAEAKRGPEEIAELCVNLDDMTAEELGFCMEELLQAGALDVYYAPIFMKKNRPAYLLTCLCRREEEESFSRKILALTTSFGLRKRYWLRDTMEISVTSRQTPWGSIRIKTGEGYGIKKSKPEYEDMARLSRETGKGLRELLKELWQERRE